MRRRREGYVVVLVVAFMVVGLAVIAVAVDIGRFFTAKRQLDVRVDAAALAAAMELPERPDLATEQATTYLQMNTMGAAPSSGDEAREITFGTTYVTNDRVTVTVSRPTAALFGFAFGAGSATVAASATAIAGAPRVLCVAPLGVIDANGASPGTGYAFGQEILLSLRTNTSETGEACRAETQVIPLDLFKGTSDYKDALSGTSCAKVAMGASLPSGCGQPNLVQNTYNAITDRLGLDIHTLEQLATFDGNRWVVNPQPGEPQPGCVRLLLAPVLSAYDDPTVTGFAFLYLKGSAVRDPGEGQGNQVEVTLVFIDSLVAGDTDVGAANSTGVRAVRLIR
jgi:Flp pilus assembly protein TadG